MRKKLRVVVDTNIIVSGLIAPGSYPAKIIDAWIAGRIFQPVVSKELLAEVNEVLQRPKIKVRLLKKQSQIRVIMGILVNKAIMIKSKRLDDGLFSDSKDHFLLELAVTAKAKTIVSGDSGIVGLLKYGEIIFQTPEAFCHEMEL